MNGANNTADVRHALSDYFGVEKTRGRTTEAVSDALREAILDGVLAPNTWLREYEIATTFAVSRTPVREALRRLADEGLAVKTANHGTVVAPFSLDDNLALYVVREKLEGLAARLAAVRCTPSILGRLNAISQQMRHAADGADPDQLARLNLAFHRELSEAAGNTYLGRFLRQVENAVRRLPVSAMARPWRAYEALGEHDAIVLAIEARDGAAAEAAAKAHIHRAREVQLSILLGE